MTVKEVLKIIHDDGWYDYDQNGSHLQLKHPTKKGKVTISKHPGDIPPGTLNSIFKQAGLEKPKKK